MIVKSLHTQHHVLFDHSASTTISVLYDVKVLIFIDEHHNGCLQKPTPKLRFKAFITVWIVTATITSILVGKDEEIGYTPPPNTEAVHNTFDERVMRDALIFDHISDYPREQEVFIPEQDRLELLQLPGLG
jgi:hypothetical protein